MESRPRKIPYEGNGGELMNALRTIFRVCFRGDRLGNRATAIVIFVLFSQASFAAVDASLGGTLRAYPLAGVMEAESGYNYLIRGSANSPFSSYVRTRALWSTAFVYNSLDGAIEFFPLAFLGLRGGGEAIQNDSKYSAFDCETYRCLGRYYRTYIEGELTLGAGPVFAQGRWRRERWTQDDGSAGDFIDPTSAVSLKSSGDSQTVYYAVAGFKFADHYTAMGVLRLSENDQLGGWSRFPYGVIRYQDGPLTLGVGAGQFESSLKTKGLSAIALIKWEFWPSLALK